MTTRGKLDIIAEVIQLSLNGANKTHIMYKGNLSYEMLKTYLLVCIRAGFIIERKLKTKVSYLSTELGREYLVHYMVIKEMVGVHPELMIAAENGLVHCEEAPNISYTSDFFKQVEITEEPELKNKPKEKLYIPTLNSIRTKNNPT